MKLYSSPRPVAPLLQGPLAVLAATFLLAVHGGPKASAAEAQTGVGQGEIKSLDQKSGGVPFSPIVETVTLQKEPVPEVKTFPKDLLSPQFAAVSLAGKSTGLVVAKKNAESSGYDTVLIDLNGDGELASSETLEVKLTERPAEGGKKIIMGISEATTIGSGDRAVPIAFQFRDHPSFPLSARMTYYPYLEAKLSVGGDSVLVGLMDKDLDGVYGGAADLWHLAKGDSWSNRPERDYALSAVNEGRFTDGFRYTLKVDEKNQVHLSRTPASGPAEEDSALHRVRIEHLWASRFDNEREAFIKARSIDTNRPKTEGPIPWRYVTFDQAKALAKESGKPLFIDVMAFWCVWCYRMDYYTYIDQEVARVLSNQYVPVKIVQEQDQAGDYRRIMDELKARGIPAMGIWNARGEKVHQIGGWKKPEDFLVDLKLGLEKAAQ